MPPQETSADREASVPSPCVRNCCLNEDDVCLGCFRVLGEIVGWSDADISERKAILARTERRREDHALKWGKKPQDM